MPLFLSPLIGWALGALGAAVVAKMVAREWQRINDELHPSETTGGASREKIPALRRDPTSGVYRPE
jgi:hypothetical protein